MIKADKMVLNAQHEQEKFAYNFHTNTRIVEMELI